MSYRSAELDAKSSKSSASYDVDRLYEEYYQEISDNQSNQSTTSSVSHL